VGGSTTQSATSITGRNYASGCFRAPGPQFRRATHEIARNVNEAASGTREVTGNIIGVSEAAEETGKEAHAVLTSANQLSQHSEAVRAAVEQYLQGIRAA
jgi:methyl-accepting chemotaxis protein